MGRDALLYVFFHVHFRLRTFQSVSSLIFSSFSCSLCNCIFLFTFHSIRYVFRRALLRATAVCFFFSFFQETFRAVWVFFQETAVWVFFQETFRPFGVLFFPGNGRLGFFPGNVSAVWGFIFSRKRPFGFFPGTSTDPSFVP